MRQQMINTQLHTNLFERSISFMNVLESCVKSGYDYIATSLIAPATDFYPTWNRNKFDTSKSVMGRTGVGMSFSLQLASIPT